jgi:hypothetical protein
MKKIALGLVAASAIFTAVPAMAQIGFYAGPGGLGVGVGAPGPYRGCGYGYPCERRYYDYYDGPAVGLMWARDGMTAGTATTGTANGGASPMIRRGPRKRGLCLFETNSHAEMYSIALHK